jgi:hypothetical protein
MRCQLPLTAGKFKQKKVVTVSVAIAIDALKRSFIGLGFGVGLRVGAFQTNFYADTAQATTLLTGCAFATDVIVNGSVT